MMMSHTTEMKDMNRQIYQKALSDEYESLRNLMLSGQNSFCRFKIKEDKTAVVQYASNEFLHLIGFSRDEAMELCRDNPLEIVYPEDLEAINHQIREMLVNKGRINARVRLKHGCDGFVWVHVFGRLVDADNGERFLNLYFSDLSEEMKNEEPVNEMDQFPPSEEMLPYVLAAIMKATTDLSFVKDADFRYLCCSKSFARMVGLKNENEVVGKTDFDLFIKKIAEKYREDDIKLLHDKKPITDMLEEIPSEDGMIHYSNTSKYVLYNKEGKVIGLYGIGRDVTEYRSAFEQLKLLTDCMLGGLAIFEVSKNSTRCRYLSDGIYQMTGYSRENANPLLFTDITFIIHEDDRQMVKEKLEQLYVDYLPIDLTYRIRTANQSIKWVNLQGTPAERQEDKVIVNVVILDVTEKKYAEEIKRIHDEEIKAAMSQIGKLICEYDVQNHVLTVPDIYAEWYGFPVELEDMPYRIREFGCLSESSISAYIDFFESILHGEKTGSLDVHIRRKDGTWHWEHYEYMSILDNDGQSVKAILAIDDVTEQHEVKQHYEYERQLRNELFSDSLIYYELNLTTNLIEEYESRLSDVPSMFVSAPTSDEMRKEILSRIAPEYRVAVRETIFLHALRKADARGETNICLEYRRLLADQKMHWVRAKATIMNKPNTKERVAFLNITNIDLEKKSQLALDIVVDEEIESICIMNLEDRQANLIKYGDEASTYEKGKVIDYSEYVDGLIKSSIYEDDIEKFRQFTDPDQLVKSLKKDNSVILAYRTKRPDGGFFRKRVRVLYLDDTHEDIVLSYRDITNLYEEEQHQKERLQEAVDLANRANMAKSEFVSSMSHDMRTPLNAILTLSGKEMLEEATDEQKREYLEKIHASGEYLLGIINDVLDMSRIESRKVVLTHAPYSLKSFCDTINTVIGEPCKQKDIHFIFEINGYACEWALIDKVRFEQIFINLLSNAVKFTPIGGTIEFIIDTLSFENNLMKQRFTVRDNGIGMSEDFLPHAFESFSQENRKDGSGVHQGTGLGLAIVEQTVELMGGSISVDSKIGSGTTFVIELEYYSTSAPKTEQSIDGEMSSLAGRRVLLCEDNPLNTEIILTLLGKKEMVVESAENGEEGLNKFKQSKPFYYDLILMDKRMPVMDGVQATKAIRKLKRKDANKIPIIALTADAFVEDENNSLDAGMNGHLAKPIEPQTLYDTISKMISSEKGTE